MELKEKIRTTTEALDNLSSIQRGQEQFVAAVRKFMGMKVITAPLLRELIDHIDVHRIESRGKNRTQRIKINYRFIGYIEIPHMIKEQAQRLLLNKRKKLEIAKNRVFIRDLLKI